MSLNLDSFCQQLPIQHCDIPLFNDFSPTLYLIRLDQLRCGTNDRVMGNKIFKLLPNLQLAKEQNYRQIVSFGGPWSNHLHALAAAGEAFDFDTVGLVRGERPEQLSATLCDAQSLGMRLQFISRSDYRRLCGGRYRSLIEQQFGRSWVVPEGGSNTAGRSGVRAMGRAIASQLPPAVDHIWMAAATGSTMAGMIEGAVEAQQGNGKGLFYGVINGVNVLKNDSLAEALTASLPANLKVDRETDSVGVEAGLVRWRLLNNAHCGGYAKVNTDLMAFHRQLEQQLGEPVDHVYMAKVFYALYQSLQAGELSDANAIAVIHSGGQQGRRGLPERRVC